MPKLDRFTITSIALLVGINVLDVILHITSGQPEALRITGNILVVVGGLLLMLSGHRVLFAVSLALYIGLNTLFTVLSGIGIAGVIFIAATTLLGLFVLRPTKKRQF